MEDLDTKHQESRNNKFWNMARWLVLLIAGGFLLWMGLTFYSPKADTELVAEDYIKNFYNSYENDPYGGDTPEEVLALFIDALEEGDTELASKYFVIEEQEKWRRNLESIKEEGFLSDMIGDLKRDKERKKLGENRITFYIYNDQETLSVVIETVKSLNDKWKIIDM
jgi:hypothetical protein